MNREVVEVLLEHCADALPCNVEGKCCIDMSAPTSDVWDILYAEVKWRSLLEQQRPCYLILVRTCA
jgi:hypothetical protein